MTMKNQKKEVVGIAKRELKSCYSENGIIAGQHHFTDYWARDGFFAALGSLAIGDQFIVENMIDLFYKHQRPDGLIPYRIMRGPVTLKKYLGKPSFYPILKPTYKLRGLGCEVLDGTTLTLLFTALLKKRKHLNRVKKALEYLKSQERSGLLYDGMMAEWNDTALKWGSLLYTNIIYWYMYDRLSSWAQTIDKNWYKVLESKKQKIALALKSKLWTGSYLADWYDYKRHDYFYPFGNCLAVSWGFTNKNESESIINECKKIAVQFTLETNFPKYPFWRIDPLQRLVGAGNYQNKDLLWWQPVLSYLVVLKKMHKISEAKSIENEIIEKVINDNGIYECYERSSKPVKRLLLTAEHPFAWGSGMFLWALKYQV